MAKPKPQGASAIFAGVRENQNSFLQDRIDELEAELKTLKENGNPQGLSDGEREALNAKIQELTIALAADENSAGVIDFDYEEISRNPLQPRSIFPESEVQTFANILEEEGQLSPGILIEITSEIREQLDAYSKQGLFESKQPFYNPSNRYILFDGERRWRSGLYAKKQGSQKLSRYRAVLAPPQFAHDLLELQAKAASTSINQKKLHPLELAQFLIAQIGFRYPQLVASFDQPATIVCPRSLNSLLVRLKREDQKSGSNRLTEMNRLSRADRSTQQAWTEANIENPIEAAVLDILFRHQQNPSTVDRHIFPLLKLDEDLREIVWRSGMDAEKLLALRRINGKTLSCSEEEARRIRTQLAEEAVAHNWDTPLVKKKVQQVLQEHSLSDLSNPSEPTASDRLSSLSRQLKKGLDDPKKQKKLEKLLQDLEALVND